MGLYPVAVVLQRHKKQNNTQNYKYSKTHILHTLKTQNEHLNLTKNLK
jgi:hypothetical protein